MMVFIPVSQSWIFIIMKLMKQAFISIIVENCAD